MAKPELVTDEAALERMGDTVDERYVAADGAVVDGGKVAEVVTTDAADTTEAGKQGSAAAGLVDGLGTVFVEYKLLGGLIKPGGSLLKKALTLGAVGALQMANVLPASLHPILEVAKEVVGEDTNIGKAVSKLAEVLPNKGDTSLVTDLVSGAADGAPTVDGAPAGAITEGDDYLERHGDDATVATAEARVKAIYAEQFGEDMLSAGAGKASSKDVESYMSANAALMAEDNVFLSCANKEPTDREFAGMRTVVDSACGMLEADLEAYGFPSSLSRPDSADTYMKMAAGLEAYEDGARKAFRKIYKDDPGKMAQAEAGLAKVMDASYAPLAESVLSVQDQYGLFTDAELKAFREKVPGVAAGLDDSEASPYVPDPALLAGPVESPAAKAEPVAVSVKRDGFDLSAMFGKSGEKPGPEVQP